MPGNRFVKTIWIHASGIVLAFSLLFTATVSIADLSNQGVVHTVFLWLKKPGDGQHRRQLLIATDRLRTIPGVLEIRFGEMIESDRGIVDDSFDIGIYFYFNDAAAMNRYLLHPLHQAIVEQDIKPLVERIVVHDFQDTVIR